METKKDNKRSKKEVKDFNRKNFYLYILDRLRNNKTLINISIELNISKQLLNYRIYALKKAGILNKIAYGVWGINEQNLIEFFNKKEVKEIKEIHGDTTLYSALFPVRSHAFQFKLILPYIRNWENRETYLKRQGIGFYNKNIGNFHIPCIIFKEHKIWLGSKTIIVYFPKWRDYFVSEAQIGFNYAINDFIELIKGLEKLLKTNFTINKQYKFKVTKHHQALINNSLAKQYNKNKEKLEVFDRKGYLWLQIDNSLQLNELETLSTETETKPIEDNEIIKQFLNELRETQMTPNTTLKIINGVLENQLRFDSNFQSHLKVVKDLGEAVNKLTEKIGDFSKTIKKENYINK